MGGHKLRQQFLASLTYPYEDLPPVFLVSFADYQILPHQPVNQFNSAVMADQQPFGQFADGNPISSGKAFNGDQGLVLLGRQTYGLRRFLTKMYELA
jgi:hypothetical protein